MFLKVEEKFQKHKTAPGCTVLQIATFIVEVKE